MHHVPWKGCVMMVAHERAIISLVVYGKCTHTHKVRQLAVQCHREEVQQGFW